MNTQNNRSNQLLNKAYDHLDGIDLNKLSLSEMKDFLEVVQKGQFLESYGQVSPYGFGGLGCSGSFFNVPEKPKRDADKAE